MSNSKAVAIALIFLSLYFSIFSTNNQNQPNFQETTNKKNYEIENDIPHLEKRKEEIIQKKRIK